MHTQAFKKLLTDPADVAGLPATSLGLAAQQAAREGHEGATAESGPWLVTLDFPSYFPVMTHAKNRALREEVYRWDAWIWEGQHVGGMRTVAGRLSGGAPTPMQAGAGAQQALWGGEPQLGQD